MMSLTLQDVRCNWAYQSGIVVMALMPCTIPASRESFAPDQVVFDHVSDSINTSANIRHVPWKVDEYQPRTDLGRKLMALRRAYMMSGGRFLDENEFDAELRARRGGLDA
jgi:hypothetical protein